MGQPPTFMYTLFACRRRHTDTNRKLLRAKLLPPSPCIHNPSGLPLPSFHAYQHKTNRGGGCQIFTAIPICFYTPLTVQHSVLSHRQLMSSMTHGNGTPHSRTCMPYLTRAIRDAVARRPADGYTTMPVPSRVLPAGNRHTVAHGLFAFRRFRRNFIPVILILVKVRIFGFNRWR